MEPVTWIKGKYTEPKTMGKHKGGERPAPKKSHHKDVKAPRPTRQKVMVLSADTGKRTWIWRAI